MASAVCAYCFSPTNLEHCSACSRFVCPSCRWGTGALDDGYRCLQTCVVKSKVAPLPPKKANIPMPKQESGSFGAVFKSLLASVLPSRRSRMGTALRDFFGVDRRWGVIGAYGTIENVSFVTKADAVRWMISNDIPGETYSVDPEDRCMPATDHLRSSTKP